MANIKYKNYTLEPETNRFNLYKTKPTVSKEGVKGTTEFSMGYGMEFASCLDHIAKDLLAEKENDLSIAEWIVEYKNIVTKITSLLKV